MGSGPTGWDQVRLVPDQVGEPILFVRTRSLMGIFPRKLSSTKRKTLSLVVPGLVRFVFIMYLYYFLGASVSGLLD